LSGIREIVEIIRHYRIANTLDGSSCTGRKEIKIYIKSSCLFQSYVIEEGITFIQSGRTYLIVRFM